MQVKRTEEEIYNSFWLLDHNKKSHSNLRELSNIISEAYQVSPHLANDIWNLLWEENINLNGLQKRYFILQIFLNLQSSLGQKNSVELLLMEEYRLPLIFENDWYGTSKALKIICEFFIFSNKYHLLIEMLNYYQKVNNKCIEAQDDFDMCMMVYSIINPNDNNYGNICYEDDSVEYFELNDYIYRLDDFLYEEYPNTLLRYLLLAYTSCLKGAKISDYNTILSCVNAIVPFSFRYTVDFLILHEGELGEKNINSTIRLLISKHDLFLRNGLDVLGKNKSWFISKISNEDVFLAFFERGKCRLADYEINYILQLIQEKKWSKIRQCFEMIVKNGDSCRVGSLLSFISEGVQSFKRNKSYQTINKGLININIETTIVIGEDYNEFSTMNDSDIKEFRNILIDLCGLLSVDAYYNQKLFEEIEKLDKKIIK